MNIDWGAFVVVAVTSLVSTAVLVSLYSVGIRLLAVRAGVDDRRPVVATVGAVACFALCVAAVLFGIYLIIPFFHA